MTAGPDPDVAVVIAQALDGRRMTRREALSAADVLRGLVASTEALTLADEPLRARLLAAADMLERQARAPARRR